MVEHKKNLKNEIQNLLNINENYIIKIEELNHIKEQKKDIENEINNILKILNLEEKTFVLDNKKIQQKKIVQYQNYSLKYLEDNLKNYLRNNLDNFVINDFLNLIKNNREKKIKNELKIY